MNHRMDMNTVGQKSNLDENSENKQSSKLLQTTPVYAFLLFLSQVPGAPDPDL